MKRSTAAIITLAGILAIYLTILSPLERGRERILVELPSKQALLQKHRQFLDKYAARSTRVQETKAQLAVMEQNIMESQDISLAMATLQSRVQDMAKSAGIKINSIRALSPGDHGNYSRLPVYVDGRGSIANISKLLNRLDSSTDIITVEKLNISTTRNTGKLRIRVQLAGLMKND